MSAPQRLEAVGLGGRTVALTIAEGRIAAVEPAAGPPRWMAMPLPVDPHLHLDKAFTWPRARSHGRDLFAAIAAMEEDKALWSPADLRRRAGLALAEAEAAGVRALRTHLDWGDPGTPTSWEVLGEMAADWRGRIRVQRAALVTADLLGDAEAGPGVARVVAGSADAVLGCFVFRNADLAAKLGRIFRLAAEHGLALDFHVDEGLDPEAQGFDEIVRLTAELGMGGRVLCGHACSLSIRPEAEVARVLAAAAEAGVGLTVLPTTNLWLQDGAEGRAPRLRGLAPVVEARAAGVEVMFGADNVADPFYPSGSHDPVEVLRLACLAAQLNPEDWIGAVTDVPARWIGESVGRIVAGEVADLLLLPGEDWAMALRRPAARRVFRAGVEQAGEAME